MCVSVYFIAITYENTRNAEIISNRIYCLNTQLRLTLTWSSCSYRSMSLLCTRIYVYLTKSLLWKSFGSARLNPLDERPWWSRVTSCPCPLNQRKQEDLWDHNLIQAWAPQTGTCSHRRGLQGALRLHQQRTWGMAGSCSSQTEWAELCPWPDRANTSTMFRQLEKKVASSSRL